MWMACIMIRPAGGPHVRGGRYSSLFSRASHAVLPTNSNHQRSPPSAPSLARTTSPTTRDRFPTLCPETDGDGEHRWSPLKCCGFGFRIRHVRAVRKPWSVARREVRGMVRWMDPIADPVPGGDAVVLAVPEWKVSFPEWRFVAAIAVIGCVMTALGDALGRANTTSTDYGASIPNPVAIGGAVGNFLLGLGRLGSVLLLLSCVASVTSLFARWLRAMGQERQQLKWFAYAAAVMIGGFLLAFTFGTSGLMWDLGFLVGIVGFAFLPLATAIAVLKYRLYDIDRIINRTLVYGSLTVVLAGVYLGGVAATQAIFQRYTGQEEMPQLFIVVSTLIIAALFTPLRRRIQAFVDRRFYRRKYDAAKTLQAFGSRLRDETDLGRLGDDLVGVVRETMQLAHASLWLLPDTASKVDGSSGRPSRPTS